MVGYLLREIFYGIKPVKRKNCASVDKQKGVGDLKNTVTSDIVMQCLDTAQLDLVFLSSSISS